MTRILAIALICLPLAAHAQAPSNMAKPSGDAAGASNGIGTQGSLTGNNGSHGSTQQSIGNAPALGDKASPQKSATPPGDAKLETDPTQGAAPQK